MPADMLNHGACTDPKGLHLMKIRQPVCQGCTGWLPWSQRCHLAAMLLLLLLLLLLLYPLFLLPLLLLPLAAPPAARLKQRYSGGKVLIVCITRKGLTVSKMKVPLCISRDPILQQVGKLAFKLLGEAHSTSIEIGTTQLSSQKHGCIGYAGVHLRTVVHMY